MPPPEPEIDEDSLAVARVVNPVGLTVAEQDELYEQGLKDFQLGQFSRAHQLWVQAGQEGHGPALCDAGWLQGSGKLGAVNQEQAFLFTLASAVLGYVRAQNNIGLYYHKGTGCQVDLRKAQQWIQRAVDAGYSKAAVSTLREIETQLLQQDSMALLRQQQQPQRLPPAAGRQQLDSDSDEKSFVEDEDDAEEDEDAAEEYLRSEDVQNVPPAQLYDLGLKAYGRGSFQQAARFWQRASDGGHAMAMCDLGWVVGNGSGDLPKDPVRGFQLTKASAELGFARAANNLGLYYFKGTGCEVDVAQAVFWLEKAQRAGYKKLAVKTLRDARLQLEAQNEAMVEQRQADYKRRLLELKAQLDQLRRDFGPDEQEHLQAAKEAGLLTVQAPPPVAMETEDGPKVRECVICMDNMADHCLLWCMHLCVCEGCARAQYLRPGSSDGGKGQCPTCRAKITKVKKVFF